MGERCVNSYSNFFHVKVKNANDLSDLNRLVSETNTWIEYRNDSPFQQWFLLGADKNSRGDALEMANYFYETGLFESSEWDPVINLVVEE